MEKMESKMVKSIMMLLVLASSNYSYAQQTTITVSNPTAAQRTELISLSMSEIKAKLGNATPKKGEAYIVKNKKGQQIGSQITYDGNLLIDACVRPHGSATYYVSIGKPYPQKVWATGALYKIRKDDIAWENDRCALIAFTALLYSAAENVLSVPISGLRTHRITWFTTDTSRMW